MKNMKTKKTKVAQVVEYITELIQTEQWLPGERLPGEIDIALRLGVSRKTVRGALKQLAEDHILDDRGRSGRFVASAANATKGKAKQGLEICLLTSGTQIALDVPAGSLAAFDLGVINQAITRGQDISCLHPNGFRLDEWMHEKKDGNYGLVIGANAKIATEGYPCLSGSGVDGITLCACGDEGWMQNFDRVCFDHYSGGYALATHLLSKGCRNILPLGGCGFRWLEQRDSGFEAALLEAGIEPMPRLGYNEKIARINPPEADTHPKVPENLQQRTDEIYHVLQTSRIDLKTIDAIALITDSMFFPTALACRKLGLTPGKDLCIVGYDAYWRSCWEQKYVSDIPEATIDKDNFTAGKTALDLLLLRVEGKLPTSPQRLLIPSTLIMTD